MGGNRMNKIREGVPIFLCILACVTALLSLYDVAAFVMSTAVFSNMLRNY